MGSVSPSSTYFDRVGLELDREPPPIPRDTQTWVQSQIEKHVPESEWHELMAMLFAPIRVRPDVRRRR